MSSSYPSGLDAFSTTRFAGTGDPDHGRGLDDLADAVNKIETELGTNPKGGYANVAARLAAGGGGSGSGVASSTVYVVRPASGGGYEAIKLSDQSSAFTHASDAAAVVQSVITALGTGGGDVWLSGSLAWGSIPRFSAGITGHLRILGLGGCKVTLSSAGPSLIAINYTADDATFQNVTVENLLLDAGNLSGATGVPTVFSTLSSGVTYQAVNFDNITVRDIKATNLHDNQHGVGINMLHSGAGRGTQTTTTNVLIERVRVEGGKKGFEVCCHGGPTATGYNALVDQIRIYDCWHERSTAPVSFQVHVNYHVGNLAQGGLVHIKGCHGRYSGDVGIETNAIDYCLIENCDIGDSISACYYHTNYNAAPNPTRQVLRYVNCRGNRTGIDGGYGWQSANGGTGNANAQNYEIIDCERFKNRSASGTNPDAINIGGSMGRVLIQNFRHDDKGMTGSTGGNVMNSICLQSTGANTVYLLRDVLLQVNGSTTNVSWLHIGISVIGDTSVQLHDWRNVRVITNVTGTTANSTGASFGVGGSTITVGGVIEGFRYTNANDSAPIGVTMNQATTVTISQPPLVWRDCDFTGMTNGTEFSYPLSGNKQFMRFERVKFRTNPLAVATISPTGSPFTYQNLDGYRETVTVQGGTVSKVELSRDNSTFVDVGTTAGAFPLEPADYIKITYSVAPTMKKIPER
jgi:hypothetical protein